MAADSIAKLAIILTGDAAPLSASLQKSLQDVDRWALGMQRASLQAAASWDAGLAKIAAANEMQRMSAAGGPMAAFNPAGMGRIPTSVLQMSGAVKNAGQEFSILTNNATRYAAAANMGSQATFKVATALSAARGNVAALANVGMSGGPAMWILAAGAAAVVLSYKLAVAADAAEVAASKVVDEWEAAYEKLNGQKIDIGMNIEDTWSGATDRLTANAAALGKPLAHVMAAATSGIAKDLEQLTTIFGLQTAAAEKQRLDILRKETEEMKQQVKLRDEAAKKAKQEAEERDKELQQAHRELESRGEALARSLRTPREEFVGALAEAVQLFEAGVLNAQNYERAAESAGKKYMEADKVREKAERQASRGVGAAERFTTAGQSAVESGRRELERIEAAQKRQVQQNEEAQRKRQEIVDAINKFRPLVLQQGDL